MKKHWCIEVDKVPSDISVQKYILQTTDIQKHIDHFETIPSPDYLALPLSTDLGKLTLDILNGIDLYGTFPFKYAGRTEVFSSYQSLAVTYNPQSIDSHSPNPHQGGLGSTLYSEGNAEVYEKGNVQKNTYGDTYSFNKRTPFANSGDLKIFLDSFKRSLIRSRLSIIKSNEIETTQLQYLWHQDEPIFFNLRINVPIISNENYVIQLLKDKDQSAEITEFSLKPGKAYVYNTQKFHRPFCKKLNDQDRINLICGVSPWFDYSEEDNCWRSNQYYGEIHPFEMLKMGYVTSLIKG